MRAAELIEVEWRRVGLIEEAARVQPVVAMVDEAAAVRTVLPRLHHHVDLRTREHPVCGAVLTCLDADFLERLERRDEGAAVGEAGDDADAVEPDVVVEVTLPVH